MAIVQTYPMKRDHAECPTQLEAYRLKRDLFKLGQFAWVVGTKVYWGPKAQQDLKEN